MQPQFSRRPVPSIYPNARLVAPQEMCVMCEKWLNIDEAVEYIRSRGIPITRSTLYTKVSRDKKPKSYKFGKALRFKISDLNNWIDSITIER
jgi:predicted DNA-binding transcriptional regulator AlpA